MRNRDEGKARRERHGRQYDGVLRDAVLAGGLFLLLFVLIALLQALGLWESDSETAGILAGIGARRRSASGRP